MILSACGSLPAVQDVADMLAQYAEGRRNFAYAKLCRVDLIGVDLTGANLRHANLSGANLTGAALSGGGLSGAGLSGANLTGADLYGVDLYGVDLYRAVGIVSAGPVGDSKRMLYAVDHGDRIMVQAGCRFASSGEVMAAIEKDYAGSPLLAPYVSAVRWMVEQLEAEREGGR
jgi:hypothetical protein